MYRLAFGRNLDQIKREWAYKDPKLPDCQANGELAQSVSIVSQCFSSGPGLDAHWRQL